MAAPAPLPLSERQFVVDIWKQVVAVQMHFNEIEMTIRNLYFTVLAAAMGLIGVVYDKHADIGFHKAQFSIAAIVVGSIPFISYLFYFMDRHWYHRLLQGAVAQAVQIETKYAGIIPEITLGTAINCESKIQIKCRAIRWPLRLLVWHKPFRDTGELHTDGKIEIFYKSVMALSGSIAVVMVFFGGVTWDGKSIAERAFPQVPPAHHVPAHASASVNR